MVKLFVSTFGKSTSWIRNAKTIEAGAALREINRNDIDLYDDVGDNISSENPYWGELTGLYWIWKNMSFSEGDIIGFCHYSKRLKVNNKQILKYFENNRSGWIVRRPIYMVAHSYISDLETIRDILKEYDPEYVKAWDAIYDHSGASVNKRRNCNGAQMFYTTYKNFNDYCQFLFDVLFKLRTQLGNVERSKFDRRYCAFFGERLLSVYLFRNNCVYMEVPPKYNENTAIGIMREVKEFLKLNSSSKTYKRIKKILRIGESSYINE